jgi:tetratricopeptide (TPR) repeat protein
MKQYWPLFILLLFCSCNKETADDCIKKGIIEENNSHFDKAISYFDAAIHIDSTYADSYYHRGICYYYLLKPDLALNDYSKAIQLQPFFLVAYEERASLLYILGEYELSVHDYDYAIKLNPKNKELYASRKLVLKTSLSFHK